jgi:hypothetical protein
MATSTEESEPSSIRKYGLELLFNCFFIMYLERIIVYTSEKNGSDENGDGSETEPFKTPIQVEIKIHVLY